MDNYLITLCVLGILVWAGVALWKIFGDLDGVIGSIAVGLFWGMVVVVFYMVIDITIISKILPHESWLELKREEQIVALNDNHQLNGNFFLITGTLDTHLTYTFFVEGPNGSIQSRSITDHADGSVSIYEIEDGTPSHYKEYYEVTKCTARKWTRWISSCLEIPIENSEEPLMWEIFVPEDAMPVNISIDLE